MLFLLDCNGFRRSRKVYFVFVLGILSDDRLIDNVEDIEIDHQKSLEILEITQRSGGWCIRLKIDCL